MPDLSVIIVSYNTREMTLKCLESLYADIGEIPAEIIVVDNASADDSVNALRTGFPHVRIIANEINLGFGAANNQAMRIARGQYILLLNSDAFLKPGAVAGLIRYLHEHPGTALVGPRLLNPDGSLQLSCYKFPSPIRATCENLLLTAAFPRHSMFGDYRAWAHDAERDVDFVIGACALVRREAVQKIGMFDEAFFIYAEETDWQKRMADAGWKVGFTPAAQVIHLNGGSGKVQSKRVFTEFRRGQERYIRKHHGILGLIWFRLMLFAGAILRITLFGMLAMISNRRQRIKKVMVWGRILAWSVGWRGPGLSELSKVAA
jgi:GT2 family glycosyltransferase